MRHTVTIALDWAIRCFGSGHVYDQAVRSLRIAEEAVELAQAYGLPKEKLIDLVNIVYSRPPGRPEQELGGVLMTTFVLCGARGQDPEAVFVEELCRVLAKSPEHFAKRNHEKLNLGLSSREAEH